MRLHWPRSIVDHMKIIAALEGRDAERAERLVREHTLGLAEHVEKYGEFLDRLQGQTNEAKGRRREAAMRAARI